MQGEKDTMGEALQKKLQGELEKYQQLQKGQDLLRALRGLPIPSSHSWPFCRTLLSGDGSHFRNTVFKTATQSGPRQMC